jgi:hypothetical protein
MQWFRWPTQTLAWTRLGRDCTWWKFCKPLWSSCPSNRILLDWERSRSRRPNSLLENRVIKFCTCTKFTLYIMITLISSKILERLSWFQQLQEWTIQKDRKMLDTFGGFKDNNCYWRQLILDYNYYNRSVSYSVLMIPYENNYSFKI